MLKMFESEIQMIKCTRKNVQTIPLITFELKRHLKCSGVKIIKWLFLSSKCLNLFQKNLIKEKDLSKCLIQEEACSKKPKSKNVQNVKQRHNVQILQLKVHSKR